MTTMEERERYERLYHSTTQHLLTRDFQAAESTVLSLLSTSTVPEDRITHHVHGLPRTIQGWLKMSEERIKAYKLWVFVLVSKYTESIASNGEKTGHSNGLFSKITETYQKEHSDPTQAGPSSPIHPSILHTILLSLLKIHSSSPTPYSDSLPAQTRQAHPLFMARQEVEKWLTGLEEDTIDRLSNPRRHKPHHSVNGNGNGNVASSSGKKGIDDDWVLVQGLTALSKGYKHVLKTYVLEILPRFEDWELSREMILGGLFPKAEEQEKLLKKLHALETQHKSYQQTRSLSASTSLTNSVTSLSSSIFSESNSLLGSALHLPSPSPSNSLDARTPSLSAFSALTDRTVRPGDYGAGSASAAAESKTSQASDENKSTKNKKELTIANEEKGDDVSLILTPTSIEHCPTGRRHSAFETMRQRIVRYLDTPLSTSDSQGEPSPTDRRRIDLTKSRNRTPLHLRLSRSPLFTGMIRALSVVSIIWFMLGMIQRRRRRRAVRAGMEADGVGGVNGIVEEVGRVLIGMLGTVKEVIKMGTTITYV